LLGVIRRRGLSGRGNYDSYRNTFRFPTISLFCVFFLPKFLLF
jgi:hypothetical protein